jgi:hypothetical protein
MYECRPGLITYSYTAFKKRSPPERSKEAMLLRMMESCPDTPPRLSVPKSISCVLMTKRINKKRGLSTKVIFVVNVLLAMLTFCEVVYCCR